MKGLIDYTGQIMILKPGQLHTLYNITFNAVVNPNWLNSFLRSSIVTGEDPYHFGVTVQNRRTVWFLFFLKLRHELHFSFAALLFQEEAVLIHSNFVASVVKGSSFVRIIHQDTARQVTHFRLSDPLEITTQSPDAVDHR